MSGKVLKKKGILAAVTVGAGASVLMTALLCLGFTALIYREILPMSAAGTCSTCSAGVAVFLSSLALGKLRGRQALPAASMIAAAFMLLAALICALGGRGSSFGMWFFRLCGATVAGGLLGAVMSIRQNPQRKTHHARR